MQKQAVPLNKKEKALIQTGNETKLAMESPFITRSKREGEYKYQSKNKVIIEEIRSYENFVRTNFSFINKKKVQMKINIQPRKKSQQNKLRIYQLQTNTKTNQNLFFKQTPIKKDIKWIKKGELLTNNSDISFGKLCLGKNLLIGYMPIEGYNFEDAIVISKKIITEKSLTSTHIKKYLIFKIDNELGKVRNKILKKKILR